MATAAADDDVKLESFLQWLQVAPSLSFPCPVQSFLSSKTLIPNPPFPPQSNGADLRSCTIRACGGKGLGVFSTAAPEPGSNDGNAPLLSPESTRLIWTMRRRCAGVAMVVPLDLAITPMRVLQDPLVGPRCRALLEDGVVDDRLLVMLFLMAERRRPGSLWKP